MNPDQIEFARALELACRHVNPPHLPVPLPLSLADLGLEGLKLKANDPLLAYRYVRGIDWPEASPQRPAGPALWAAERGLTSEPSVAAEIAPGVVGIGDSCGVLRVFSRSGRARWECIAVLCAHTLMVSDLTSLQGGGFISVSIDGSVAVCKCDASGRWHVRQPQVAGTGELHAVCQLRDGSVILGGVARRAELTQMASGEWSGKSFPFDGSNDIALAAWGADGFCVVPGGQPPKLWIRHPGGWKSDDLQLPHADTVTDVTEWGHGVALATASGEIALVDSPDSGVRVHRISSSAIRTLQALGPDWLATWSEGGQLRIWKYQNNRFEVQSEFDSILDVPRPVFAGLCDGRILYRKARDVLMAGPDPNGIWRPEETLSDIQGGVRAIAALGADTVAFVDQARLVIARPRNKRDLEVDYVTSALGSITALAAVDANTLAVANADGMLWLLRRGAANEGWTQHHQLELSGPIYRVAATEGWLAVATRKGPAQMFRWSAPASLEMPIALDVRDVAAMALDREGRFALVDASGALWVWNAPGTAGYQQPVMLSVGTGVSICALHWVTDSELLVLDQTGVARRVSIDPASKATYVSAAGPGSGVPLMAVADDGSMVFARGASGIQIRPAQLPGAAVASLPVTAIHGDVKALAICGSRLFVGADALYILDYHDPLSPESGIRRVLVGDDWVLDASLDAEGQTQALTVRRRKGAVWSVRDIGGKPIPDDPILHQLVGLLDPNGRLAQITQGSRYTVNADRTLFRVESSG